MKGVLQDFFVGAAQLCSRSSLAQWLLGVFLTLLAGLMLYAFGSPQRATTPPSMARNSNCLQVAGSDLKLGELLVHDASCTCSLN